MIRKHLRNPPSIGLCLCCFLSACQVVPNSPEVLDSKVTPLEPVPVPAGIQEQPTPAQATILDPSGPEPQTTNKALQDVAIGDDHVSVLEILGKPHRSTQVATSNGERLAWEYFHPSQKNPPQANPKLQWLIIFDQKTGRVKTIEQYPL
jgi:hypothetical protein